MNVRGTLETDRFGEGRGGTWRTEDGGRLFRRPSSSQRLGGKSLRRHDSGFKALNRDSISASAYLKSKISGRAGNDAERPSIRRSERWGGGVATDKNMRGILEAGRDAEGRWRR